jgi:hypothetical protein
VSQRIRKNTYTNAGLGNKRREVDLRVGIGGNADIRSTVRKIGTRNRQTALFGPS